MNRWFTIICIISLPISGFSQSTSLWRNSDSLSSKRFGFATTAIATTWTVGTIGLSSVWYDEFQKTNFHTFDDGSDWLQMDKVGHMYTTAHLSEANFRLFRWTGLGEKKSAWLGIGIGLGFQTTLELLDGRNADWGFSWYDMAANGLGAGLFLSQQLIWHEQRFVLKFSSHPTEFAAFRPEVLGSSFAEKVLKDYNGQTYWLSFSPKSFTEKWPLPSWVNLAFGYSVDEKLAGSTEYYTTNDKVFQSSRQFLFSLDIDVRELPIKNKWLKAVLRPFHYIKIPFPTIIVSQNGITGSAFYF